MQCGCSSPSCPDRSTEAWVNVIANKFWIDHEDGSIWHDPSSDTVLHLVEDLKLGQFLIVSRTDLPGDVYYAQTVGDGVGSWVVEYQDGDLDRHYQADAGSAALVERVLTGWAQGTPGWLELLNWRHVKL